MLLRRVSRLLQARGTVCAAAPLTRSLHTSSIRSAAPTAPHPQNMPEGPVHTLTHVDVPQPISSFFGRLFSKSSTMPRVTTDVDFPGLPTCSNTEAQIVDSTTVSTLPNGVRVASVSLDSAFTSPLVSVGVFVDAGARDESKQQGSVGASYLLRLMATRSTVHTSDFLLVKKLLSNGAELEAAASRETISYATQTLLQKTPAVIKSIAEIVSSPAFHEFEVKHSKDLYEEHVQQAAERQELTLLNSVHEAAFGSSGLGRPVLGNSNEVSHLNAAALRSFHANTVTPRRVLVAAVGIPHDQLVSLAEANLGSLTDSSTAAGSSRAAAKYVGGDIRRHDSGASETSVAIAFNAGSWSDKDLLPFYILQAILGGNGKGRLGKLASSSSSVSQASAYNRPYSDAGLFALSATGPSSSAAALANSVVAEARALKQVSDAEVLAAKNQLRASVAALSEDRSFQLHDLGQQLLATGRFVSPATVASQIDRVTTEDVRRAAARLLSSAPSIAAQGDCTSLPRYDVIANALRQ